MHSLELFHLLRPSLLFLLPVGWFFAWWLLKQQNDILRWKKLVKPELLEHLLIDSNKKFAKLQAPWHLALVWTLITFALSGPAWKLKPAPFTQDEAQIVCLLKVTESMQTKDLSPSRLKRAVFKMKDFMTLRPESKIALVVYSGSAHLVLPLTKDHAILNTFAQALSPEIMPSKGDDLKAALALSAEQLKDAGGTIIVFTDNVEVTQAKEASKIDLGDAKVLFYAISSAELLNHQAFEKSANILNTQSIEIGIDDKDIHELSSLVDRAFKQAGSADATRYEEGGYWLLPLIVFLMLLWFRRGFIAEAWRVS